MDLENELIIVHALFHALVGDAEIDLEDGGIDGIDGNEANWLVIGILAVGGDVAAAVADNQFHLKIHVLGNFQQVEILVDNPDVGIILDLGRCDDTFALVLKNNGDFIHRSGMDHQLLEAQDQVDVVRIGSGNRREFVVQTFDADKAYSRALDRG